MIDNRNGPDEGPPNANEQPIAPQHVMLSSANSGAAADNVVAARDAGKSIDDVPSPSSSLEEDNLPALIIPNFRRKRPTNCAAYLCEVLHDQR